MRELTKSIGSFSWAMSLFGARQVFNALQPSRATDAFDHVTRETERQLDGVLRSTFQAGDRLGRSLVDLTFGLFTLQGFDPGRWGDAGRRGDGGGWSDPGRWGDAASRAAGGVAEAMRQTAEATGRAAGSMAEAVARPRVPAPGGSPAAPPGAGASPFAATPGPAGGGGGGGLGWGPMP